MCSPPISPHVSPADVLPPVAHIVEAAPELAVGYYPVPRSANNGSARVARYAGTRLATPATITSNTATTANVGRSVALTSNRSAARTRVSPHAPTSPTATPTIV